MIADAAETGRLQELLSQVGGGLDRYLAFEHPDAMRAPDGVERCDVVVVGSGAGGASVARVLSEAGASVIVVEANYDVGGHAIISGGHMALGGGTSAQQERNKDQHHRAGPSCHCRRAFRRSARKTLVNRDALR